MLSKNIPLVLCGRVESKVDTAFSWFRSFIRICCSLKLNLVFCDSSLRHPCLADRILFLIVSDVSSASFCRVSLMIFLQGPSVSCTEFSHFTWQDSANIGIPSPPNLGRSEIKIFSYRLQVIHPVMDGMNSV